MLILDQKVIVKWNSRNKKHFINLGYIFTKFGDEIEIKVEDLFSGSHVKVKVECDYCGSIIEKPYYHYLISNKNLNVDCCVNCANNKRKDINLNKYNSISKLDIYKLVLNNKIPNYPSEFFTNINNNDIKNIILFFVSLLIKDGIIKSIDELPNIIRQHIFIKYKLTTFINRFNIFDLLNITFPDKWKPWELCRVKNNYWTDINNINETIYWLINKLLEDKIINTIEDIIYLDKSVFKNYGLHGLLYSKFNDSPYSFWNYCLPNKWYQWEFKNTPKYFWTIKENRINALKQLCEERLYLDVVNIPNYMSYRYLVGFYHKFSLICDYYYNSNLFLWINESYPTLFTPEQFNQIISSDGVKLDSNDEKIIHEYLIKNFSEVNYYDNNQKNSYKWHNNLTDENYIADWIINNNIIIEYFGWYNKYSYGKSNLITDYIDKANRKIEYFSSLDNYNFIAFFPNDLKNNLKGVKEKLSIINN
jgi:hypothetical protein